MDKRTSLFFGALLHDIGKVVFRGISEKGTHSQLGANFIKNEIVPLNASFDSSEGACVVEQIRYHHGKEMRASSALSDDSLAYITYFADNISAGMDRKNEGDETEQARFDKTVELRKIFNIINGHADDNTVGRVDYNKAREDIKRNLVQLAITPAEVNSLMHVLEATCSNTPSSTDVSQLVDVSLFDHAKTTAGIAACVYDYLESMGVTNFREALFSSKKSDAYYAENMFLMVSCDISGIQNFIYTISGDGALKQLRARSLYLEIMVEHIVDELLERLQLHRTNLLYTGGGHAQLILPNTPNTQRVLREFQEELKQWFLKHYATDLYMGMAWTPCSANDLSNRAEDGKSFAGIFKRLAQQMSRVKAARYTAEDIKMLNFGNSQNDSERECNECHRSEMLQDNEDGSSTKICTLCYALRQISADFIKKEVFVVSCVNDAAEGEGTKTLKLPFNCVLTMYSRDAYKAEKPQAKRVYSKNEWDAGLNLATHIWMGDYTAPNKNGISDYAQCGQSLDASRGIQRLGVLRADVDNLGATFSGGFPANKASISRTATLSRNLSFFFKNRINEIMKQGGYELQIIYSGGDDLFIVGNWSDVLYAAIDINKEFKAFTGNGCLTISAGIGMFAPKYPIARMAEETGALEDAAKLFVETTPEGNQATKNALALWHENAVCSWDTFTTVVEPRMREVATIFNRCEKGKAFIYQMIALLRSFNEVISAPRLAYLLARSFEDAKDAEALAQKFYGWATDEKQRQCLIIALEWYVYSIRER